MRSYVKGRGCGMHRILIGTPGRDSCLVPAAFLVLAVLLIPAQDVPGLSPPTVHRACGRHQHRSGLVFSYRLLGLHIRAAAPSKLRPCFACPSTPPLRCWPQVTVPGSWPHLIQPVFSGAQLQAPTTVIFRADSVPKPARPLGPLLLFRQPCGRMQTHRWHLLRSLRYVGAHSCCPLRSRTPSKPRRPQ